MNKKADANKDYWRRRWAQVQATGGNYDTMICWTPDEYAEEAKILGEAIEYFLGGHDMGKVVDFGCGKGRFAPFFKDYVGLDIIPALVEENRKAHPGKRFETIPSISMDAKIPICDIVLAVTVLQHIDDETLRGWLNMFKVAAENLIIVESVGAANEHTYRRDWTEILKGAGYGVIKRKTFKSRETYDLIWAI